MGFPIVLDGAIGGGGEEEEEVVVEEMDLYTRSLNIEISYFCIDFIGSFRVIPKQENK